uniref:CCHC-type domain-containing protein n=1 Tax=Peronospora matthiolae TaxID=2874970 RepID=A0AAV1TKU7_9STRA
MVAVSDARDGADSLVIDNIVHHASPEMMNVVRSNLLSAAAARWVVRSSPRTWKANLKGAITCYRCERPGHIAADCRAQVVHDDETPAEGRGASMIPTLTEKRRATMKKRNKRKKGSRDKDAAAITASDEARSIDDSCRFVLTTRDGVRATDGTRGLVLASTTCSHEIAKADGESLYPTRVGSVHIEFLARGAEAVVTLTDVYLAPRLAKNIVSYGKLANKRFTLVHSGHKRSLARCRDGAVAFDATIDSNVLYVVTKTTRDKESAGGDVFMAALEAHATETNADEPRSLTVSLAPATRPPCGKQKRNAQSQQDSGKHSPIYRIGGVICSDQKGPMTPQDRLDNIYLVNFVDHKSSYCRFFLARTKDVAEKQFEAFLVTLRSFSGSRSTCSARTAAENTPTWTCSASARASRTKCRRSAHDVCLRAVSDVLGRRDAIRQSPSQPELHAIKRKESVTNRGADGQDAGSAWNCQFGSQCCVHRYPSKNSLLQRSGRTIIVGFSEEIKGYKVLLSRDNKRAMDVCDRAGGLEETYAPAAAVERDGRAEGNRATRKSRKRWTRAVHGTTGASNRAEAAARQEETAASVEFLNAAFEHDPLNYGQAMRSGKREGWEKAVKEEIAALGAIDVWTITRRTAGQHALHTKWVYKTEKDAQGDLERLKARLVVSGHIQVLCVDYTLTFAAVMDLSTVKVILALVASELVLELRKSLYGLKQAGRLWSHLLHSKLSTAGFTRCESDVCFYWEHDGDDLVVVGVYADNLQVTGTSAAAVERFFASLASLSIKDMKCVSKFLGMRVTHSGQNGYTPDQE